MPFDHVWTEWVRDWHWLWLRKKKVHCQAPIDVIDMTSITLLEPVEPAFLRILEAEVDARFWPAATQVTLSYLGATKVSRLFL
jgi:hypothetical protein